MARPFVVQLTAHDVAPVRAMSFSDGAKAEGGERPGDRSPETLHVGVRIDEGIVAVGTLNRDPSPRNPHQPVWRVRGMATLKEHRGNGYGSDILQYLIAHIAAAGGGLLWGNLRLAAVPFYERHGFTVHDDIFQTAGGTDHRYGELLIPAR
jgi:GNAT superfamily N-acetyltransferase